MIEKKIIEILTQCYNIMVSFQDAPDKIVRLSKYLRFVLHFIVPSLRKMFLHPLQYSVLSIPEGVISYL